MILDNAVCVLSQFDQYLELACNSFRRGHRTICWERAGLPGVTFSARIKSWHIVMSGFEISDDYTFFTYDDDMNESERKKFHFNYISAEKFAETLCSYVSGISGNESAEMLAEGCGKIFAEEQSLIEGEIAGADDIEQALDENTASIYMTVTAWCDACLPAPSFVLARIFLSASEHLDEETEAYARMLSAFSRYDFARAFSINKSGSSANALPCLSLAPDDTVDRLEIALVEEKKAVPFLTVEPMQPVMRKIILPPNTQYIARFMRNMDIMCELRGYAPDSNVTALLWEDNQELSSKLSDAMSASFLYDAGTSGLTAEEIALAIKEQQIEPADWLFSAPEPESEGGSILRFRIKDYDLMYKTGRNFYLAAREDEVLLDASYEHSALISSASARLDLEKSYLGGDMAVYIIDESHRVVSKVTHISEGEDASEYREKLRIARLEAYFSRLLLTVKSRMPSMHPIISGYCDILKSEEDVNEQNVWHYLASMAIDDQRQYDVFPAICLIYEDFSSQFSIDQYFYRGDGPRYIRALDILSFPYQQYRDSIIVVTDFDDGGDMQRYVYQSGNSTIDLCASDFRRCIIYAMDLNTMSRSGFIALERTQGHHRAIKSRIEVVGDDGIGLS